MVNVPGYLPENEPAVFDTAIDAWQWLREELERDAEMERPGRDYNAARRELDKQIDLASVAPAIDDITGAVYTTNDTDAYDLGLAYSVMWTNEAELWAEEGGDSD